MRVLILPGLFNSGPDHWQTHWEARFPWMERVLQDDWEKPDCADWVARLQSRIAEQAASDTYLVGHSSSCALIAKWAEFHGPGPVRGALLVAPSDSEAPSYPAGPTGFAPMPLGKLPFASIVVSSSNDEYVSPDRARHFAACWGSEFVEAGPLGHINSASKLGVWPAGLDLLGKLARTPDQARQFAH